MTAKNRSLKTDTHFFDLGKSGSFLSFEDIAVLGADESKWPSVLKETDPKKIGALVSGRCATADRFTAARAFMAMLDKSGTSKAAMAAARWIGLDTLTTTYLFERDVLNRLKGVSDADELKEEIFVRPPFCSPHSLEPSTEALASYGFGVNRLNRDAMVRVTSACRTSAEGWVPYCIGGKAMGFQDGDIDITLVNAARGASVEVIKEELLQLSQKGVATVYQISAGTLVHVPDLEVGNTLAPCDVLLSKGGLGAAAKIVYGGLFWNSVLDVPENAAYFATIRNRARNCGVIGAKTGLLNMWTVMMTALEYLCLEGLIALRLDTPLAGQSPVCLGFDMTSVPELVEGFFCWMSEGLADSSYVFGSFSIGGKWSSRPSSEFSASSDFRVCRDPFATRIDNSMRAFNEAHSSWVIRQLRHAAYCTSQMPHWLMMNGPIPQTSESGSSDAAKLSATREVERVTSTLSMHKGIHVCCCSPAYSYGISAVETDARIRALVNSGRAPRDDVMLILGDAMHSEFGASLSAIDILENANNLYYALADEDDSIILGSCEHDGGRDSVVLRPLDRSMTEFLMNYLALKSVEISETAYKKEWLSRIGVIEEQDKGHESSPILTLV